MGFSLTVTTEGRLNDLKNFLFFVDFEAGARPGIENTREGFVEKDVELHRVIAVDDWYDDNVGRISVHMEKSKYLGQVYVC